MSDRKAITRSELARQRRAQRSSRELSRTGKRVMNSTVPVTSRFSLNDGLASRKPRRFNIALGAPDVHLRRSTSTNLLSGWRLAALLLALLAAGALYTLFTIPYFRVSSVTLLGETRIPPDEIAAGIGVQDKPIFLLSPADLTARLYKNFPEVLSAQVKLGFPNRVNITLVERQPVILWQQGQGYTWIDTEGVPFRPRNVVEGLVPVTGLDTPPASYLGSDDPALADQASLAPVPFISKELVQAVLALGPYVPADSVMVYDNEYGLGWTDNRGWDAYFGSNINNMPLKASVYQALVDSLLARGIAPVMINVMYPDAPFYRVNKADDTGVSLKNGQ